MLKQLFKILFICTLSPFTTFKVELRILRFNQLLKQIAKRAKLKQPLVVKRVHDLEMEFYGTSPNNPGGVLAHNENGKGIVYVISDTMFKDDFWKHKAAIAIALSQFRVAKDSGCYTPLTVDQHLEADILAGILLKDNTVIIRFYEELLSWVKTREGTPEAVVNHFETKIKGLQLVNSVDQ